MFKIIARAKKTKARKGVLKTPHGSVITPAFMPCATRGVVRGIGWDEIKDLGYQLILVNAYHLYLQPGLEALSRFKDLRDFCGWQGPILCDSGGYQVFSLNPQIGDGGVRFRSHLNGQSHYLTPEKVIEINRVLGSDLIMPLDECPGAGASREQVQKAVERTERWLLKSIQSHVHLRGGQYTRQGLFGIIQGGVHRDLREKAAQTVSDMFNKGLIDGIAVGGVSVGESKEDIRQVISWMGAWLPEKAPKYLMGVGEPEDIVYAVKQGFDLFDCVLPTRLGRHGVIYQSSQSIGHLSSEYQKLDLKKARFREDKGRLRGDKGKGRGGEEKRGYVHHLLKLKEIQGGRICSQHNLAVYAQLMEQIRRKIELV